MAGIGKAGFLAYVVQGFVGVKQHVVGLADSYKFNIFLAGFAKLSLKLFCKI